MFIRKTGRIVFFILTGWFGSHSFCWAQTPNQNFINQMNADYQTISSYINGQFAKSMGFYSTLGWSTPPGVFELLGSPKVEVSVGAGADIVGLSNLNSLPLQALLVSSNVSLPSIVPIPFPIATVRVGLLKGLDVGFRLTYLPQIDLSNLGLGFSANYTGWGLDFRYKIFDGLHLPTVTVGASWDTMNGTFALATNVNQNAVYTDPGTGLQYNDNLTGTNTFTQSWDVKSFGAKLMVGKDLGIIYPFAAVGFQRNSGDVSANITGSVTETVTGPLPTNTPQGSSTVSLAVGNHNAPIIFEPKYVLGFDVGEGFHWQVVGESNGTDIAGTTNFSIQF